MRLPGRPLAGRSGGAAAAPTSAKPDAATNAAAPAERFVKSRRLISRLTSGMTGMSAPVRFFKPPGGHGNISAGREPKDAPVQYRNLGSTGVRISAVSFGAGPVPAVMTGGQPEAQAAVVRRALELRINWFDTAATYGNGRSEQGLGGAFTTLGIRPDPNGDVHVATKARVM